MYASILCYSLRELLFVSRHFQRRLLHRLSPSQYRVARIREKSDSRAAALQIIVFTSLLFRWILDGLWRVHFLWSPRPRRERVRPRA